jgi:hypothetical protein
LSLFAGISFFLTLDSLSSRAKIKIVRKSKTMLGARISRAASSPDHLRPYSLRISRDHGGGLWTIEDDEGQLYLAVLSREVTAHRRRRELAEVAPLIDSGHPEYVPPTASIAASAVGRDVAT